MGVILQMMYRGEVEESYNKGENENNFGHKSVCDYISYNNHFFPCICNNLEFMLLLYNWVIHWIRSESISLHV